MQRHPVGQVQATFLAPAPNARLPGPMSESCPECGAPLPGAGGCREHFHALLALEWQIPGGPGELAHFYAVATYGLQHPAGMNFTAETLAGLRQAVGDALAGRATVADLRGRMGTAARGASRVTRRDGDPEARWDVEAWPMTITDVLTVAPERGEYLARVSRWAASVLAALAASRAHA